MEPAVREFKVYPKIPSRTVRACIKQVNEASRVVDVVCVGRNGLCFRSFDPFTPEATISIATHYVEGGHNIFQNGRIARAFPRISEMLPTEYEVEFLAT
jgi:hypothetical protein